MTSFEPGEDWFWDFTNEVGVLGQPLAPPTAHPEDQPVPGPADRCPTTGSRTCTTRWPPGSIGACRSRARST